MTEEPVKETPSKGFINALTTLIDRLTDPIELAIRKTFSARFIIAVGTTFALYKLSMIMLAKYPESAPQIFTCYSTAWGTIVGFYFGASMMTPIEGKKKEE